MKQFKKLSACIAWIAAFGMCFPLHAIEPTIPSAQGPAHVVDIALADGGALVGRLVNAQGVAQSGVEVIISQPQAATAFAATTNDDGWFVVRDLRGGVYQLQTDQASCVCRAWADETAPPSAQRGILLVNDPNVIAGQWQPGTLGTLLADTKATLTHPLVVGGIIATAVAVPVAIHNSKDDDNNTGS